jgi:hypothetical protein
MRFPNYLTVIFLEKEGGWIPPVLTGRTQSAQSPRGTKNDGLQPGYMSYSPTNQTARLCRLTFPGGDTLLGFRISRFFDLIACEMLHL